MYRQNVVYPNNGILFGNKKEAAYATTRVKFENIMLS